MAYEENALVAASRRRVLLSIYLDFVTFSVPWALLDYFVFRSSADLQKLSTPAKFITFAIVEFALHRIIRWSPGEWLLGIQRMDRIDISRPVDVVTERPTRVVDAAWKARESTISIVAAVLLLLEGSKGLVRWTMWTPPSPMFGSVVPDDVWPLVAMTGGAIECLIAYLLFRARPIALAVGVPYFVVMLASVATSWGLWDSWVAENIRRRRAYQGLPIRAGEVEQAQAVTPEIVIAGIVLYLVLLIVASFVIIQRRRRITVRDSPA